MLDGQLGPGQTHIVNDTVCTGSHFPVLVGKQVFPGCQTVKTRWLKRHVPHSRRAKEPTRRPKDTGGASNDDHAFSLVSHGGLAVVGPKADGGPVGWWQQQQHPSGCICRRRPEAA